MNITINCKNCETLLSVKEKPGDYIYTCPKCEASFNMNLRFGSIGSDLIFHIVPLILACLLSGGDSNLMGVYIVVFSILLVLLFVYRPYSMQIIKQENVSKIKLNK